MTTKIVLTGGPCAGKTTALSRIIEKFSDKGYLVLTVPEAATLFNQAGVNFLTDDKRLFHAAEKSLLEFQMAMEDYFLQIAEAAERPALIICDRGVMDVAAYLSAEAWQALLDELGMSAVQARDKRYDAVLHLTTAAKGAEQFYTTANNSSRTENIELARTLDDKLIAAWTGHPHLRIVDNSVGFEGKLNRVLAEISAVLGIPEPIETERKYVVELVGDLPDGSVETEIFQTYLQSDNGEELRLRKRGQNGHFIYFLTRKRTLHGNSRMECERQITPSEYVQHLAQADPNRTTIHKKRTCFVYENRYFELDTFVNPALPFSLLEIEDAERHEDIQFPPFIKIVEDVTDNKEFYNSNLANRKNNKS
ncbi:MAG: AAA family ATPase [Bacteroidales bacterium]|jgi:CYTH domain-containing protein/thymidylate kinase|nr:AAA family ATPase [Bacteroidales bacterium]